MQPASKPTKKPVSVLVSLHDGAGHVLLLERADREGFWQSVTGSLEDGETPVQAALREVAEETGIVLAESSLHDWRRNLRALAAPLCGRRNAQYRTLVFRLHRPQYAHPPVRAYGLCVAACTFGGGTSLFAVQPRDYRRMASHAGVAVGCRLLFKITQNLPQMHKKAWRKCV